MKYLILPALAISISVSALAGNPIRVEGNLAYIIKEDSIAGFRAMLIDVVKGLEEECELFADNEDEALEKADLYLEEYGLDSTFKIFDREYDVCVAEEIL